ncbi:MAG: adenylate kinase [Bacteroidales bacterium]|jgi:adenylate kinase|nr:adenylate kinase [Bacteroidales bacterium]MDD6959919.1 adenylate kinase [Bacteroidales bacterium]MDY6186017.1 adenylate kinase [Muribaculaceae bacterium]
MLNLVIFGAPGSGKGTQSEKLIDRYHLHHISTGEVLRDHIARGTELGRTADSYISQGQLIPDELMLRVLEHELDNNPDKTAEGVIFDGFPRTIPQALALKDMMKRRGQKIHAVIGLEVPEDQLMERMVLRGKESGRSDDNPETIRKRLAVYHKQTQPLRDYYVGEGVYVPIKGDGTVDQVFERVIAALDKK